MVRSGAREGQMELGYQNPIALFQWPKDASKNLTIRLGAILVEVDAKTPSARRSSSSVDPSMYSKVTIAKLPGDGVSKISMLSSSIGWRDKARPQAKEAREEPILEVARVQHVKQRGEQKRKEKGKKRKQNKTKQTKPKKKQSPPTQDSMLFSRRGRRFGVSVILLSDL